MTRELNATETDLLVVIVNYRTPKLTIDCLTSLARHRPEPDYTMKAIVVDNASDDGSAQQIQAAITQSDWGDWCALVQTETNLGFAGGNNFGIRYGPDSRYVLLLNSDTLVHEQTLAYCLHRMDRETQLGAISCRLMQPDGAVQTQARRFPAPWREALNTLGLPMRWPSLFEWASSEDLTWHRGTERRNVDWLGGAFMLLRRSALNQVGLLDDGFFFYGEDIELCFRLAESGWGRRYDPTVAITHLGGGSSETAPMHTRAAYWKARYQVQRRCYGRLWAESLRRFERGVWTLRRVKAHLSPRSNTEQRQSADHVWQQLRQVDSGRAEGAKS